MRALNEVKDSIRKKALRRGLMKAGRLVSKNAKGRLKGKTKATTGLLKKRLKVWSKTYTDGRVVVFAGYRKDDPTELVPVKADQVFRVLKKGGRIVRLTQPLPGQLQQRRNPAYYAHLVERGFTQTSGKHIPGRPFLRPALDATKSQCEQILAAEIKAGIEEAAAKARKHR